METFIKERCDDDDYNRKFSMAWVAEPAKMNLNTYTFD